MYRGRRERNIKMFPLDIPPLLFLESERKIRYVSRYYDGGVIRHCRRWINMEQRPVLFPEIKGNEGKVGKSGIGIGDPEGC